MAKGGGMWSAAQLAALAAVVGRNAMKSRSVGPGWLKKARAATAAKAVGKARAAPRTVYRRKKQNPYARRGARPAIGGRASFSKQYYFRKPSPQVKAMKRVGAPNYYNVNFGFRGTAESGFQGAQFAAQTTLADLKQLMLKVPTASGTNNVTRFVLESTSSEMLLTNNTTATAYVDIYDIVRKRDANKAIGTQDPLNAWSTGLQLEVPGGGTGDEFKNLNCLPGDSRLLRDYFKVIKRTHIGLTQGATHRHLTTQKLNKIVGNELLLEAEGDLAGYTVYTMIVCYGQPDSIAQEGAPPLVSTAPVAIDVVQAVRYKFSWVQDVATSYYFTDNLSTLAGDIVNIGSGAIEHVQEVNP